MFVYIKKSPMPVGRRDRVVKRRAVIVLNITQEERLCLDVCQALGCQADKVRLLLGTVSQGETNLKGGRPTLAGWESRVYLNFGLE